MGSKLAPQLASLRAGLLPFAGRKRSSFYPLKIRPSLTWCLAPRRADRKEDGRPQRDRQKELLLAALGPNGPEPGAAGGLVEGMKSESSADETSARYGLKGLSAAGASSLRDACALLGDRKALCGFWTVTLPPEAADQLDSVEDGAQIWIRALIRSFAQLLTRRLRRQAGRHGGGVRAEYCYVIEPQKNGRPHIHVVYVARWNRWKAWAVGKADLDRLVRQSLAVVTGQSFREVAASNVQRVKRSPGRYLGKYVSKATEGNAAEVVLAGGYGPNLIPHQWWGWSAALRDLVACHTFELPGCFVNWLSRQWPGLAQLGRLEARLFQPDAIGAPCVVVGSWHSVRALVEVVEHLDALMRQTYDPAVSLDIS
jgi:hypothetical protein